MNFKLKPLSLAALATATVLSGCGTEEETIQKTTVFDAESNTGLWCKSPDIVQTVDADFHPLTENEVAALKTVALSIADPDNTFSDTEKETFRSSFNAYEFDYGTYDLYQTLGLTKEEEARRLVAKEEARQFKIDQKQDVIFGDDFDTWFDAWFETVPYTDYLGNSQRLPKAALGLELALSASNNGEEACYTPPTDCPNYQMVDESGKYNCIIPEENPIEDVPALPQDVITAAATGEKAVVFFRKNGEQVGSNYENITIHSWNDTNCTAYNEETSTTAWGSGLAATDIDDNYGMYWILDLQEGHDSCGNMIVYNKSTGDKFITQNDGMVPLGKTGDVVFHNLDKISFYQEGFPANLLDGAYLANQHPFFGAAAGGKSCGWGTSLDEAGEACLGQVIENCPEGTYAVGVGQVDIASKCVAEFDPEETTFLLRGGFNGWGNPTEGTEFEKVAAGEYRKIFTYGEHPEDAVLEFPADASVEVMTEAGATLTFVQPVNEEGENVDVVLDLNNIPADTILTLADGTAITLAADNNMLMLPEGVETPEVAELMFAIPASSKLTLASGANHDDFACTEDCVTAYSFKIADADWSEPASYGGVSGGEALEVGGNPKPLTAGENVGQDIGIKMQDTSLYQFKLMGASANEMTLEVDQVPVNAFPEAVMGDVSTPMVYEGNGVYKVANIEISEGTHQLTFVDSVNSFAYGAGDTAGVGVNQDLAIATGSSPIQLTVPKTDNYDLILDLSDLNAPKFKAFYAPFGSTKVYIRGALNGWGAPDSDALVYNQDEQSYSVLYGLEASTDSYPFKFASADWSTQDIGFSSVTLSEDADALSVSETGGNMQITVGETSTYLFKLTFNPNDFSQKPELKISNVPIYIRGGMNGWGETNKLAFVPTDSGNSNEAGKTLISEVELPLGSLEFKVASSDWSTVDLGSSTDGKEAVVIGESIGLGKAGDNNLIITPTEAGDYTFKLDVGTKTLTVTKD
ncbi:hypothetical protein N9W11_02375 [Psychrosphaera haliotis]|nr:hypothetical protein [Psychrosphaera haliotis]